MMKRKDLVVAWSYAALFAGGLIPVMLFPFYLAMNDVMGKVCLLSGAIIAVLAIFTIAQTAGWTSRKLTAIKYGSCIAVLLGLLPHSVSSVFLVQSWVGPLFGAAYVWRCAIALVFNCVLIAISGVCLRLEWKQIVEGRLPLGEAKRDIHDVTAKVTSASAIFMLAFTLIPAEGVFDWWKDLTRYYPQYQPASIIIVASVVVALLGMHLIRVAPRVLIPARYVLPFGGMGYYMILWATAEKPQRTDSMKGEPSALPQY